MPRSGCLSLFTTNLLILLLTFPTAFAESPDAPSQEEFNSIEQEFLNKFGDEREFYQRMPGAGEMESSDNPTLTAVSVGDSFRDAGAPALFVNAGGSYMPPLAQGFKIFSALVPQPLGTPGGSYWGGDPQSELYQLANYLAKFSRVTTTPSSKIPTYAASGIVRSLQGSSKPVVEVSSWESADNVFVRMVLDIESSRLSSPAVELVTAMSSPSPVLATMQSVSPDGGDMDFGEGPRQRLLDLSVKVKAEMIDGKLAAKAKVFSFKAATGYPTTGIVAAGDKTCLSDYAVTFLPVSWGKNFTSWGNRKRTAGVYPVDDAARAVLDAARATPGKQVTGILFPNNPADINSSCFFFASDVAAK